MNYTGLISGLFAFVIIGLFHPLVIYGDYYFGVKCWWGFAVAGAILAVSALFVKSFIASSLLGITGFSCFWSIHELFQQQKRVEKGWFPKRDKSENVSQSKNNAH